MSRRIARLLVLPAVAFLAATAAPPAAAAPVDGRGAAVFSTVEEYSHSWRALMSLEGTFSVGGQTYGFFGNVYAYNNCCSYLGSSGSGYWYFSGTLISPLGVGSTTTSSSPMTYTRTTIVPDYLYTMEMRLTAPAWAYLPDGSTVNYNVSFTISGLLSDDDLEPRCGAWPGCRYDATYVQNEGPPLVGVSPTGGASSTGVSVGYGNSTTSGGLACVSVTGVCSGGSIANVCVTGGCAE
jgi:hypothetical protein